MSDAKSELRVGSTTWFRDPQWGDWANRASRFPASVEERAMLNEIVRLRAELTRTAEVIGAQTFGIKSLAKCRREVLVQLASELLMIAEGGHPYRSRTRYDTDRTPEKVRQRFPDLAAHRERIGGGDE